MHFMSSSDTLEIRRVDIPKDLEALVDENIMNYEISESVDRDAQAYPKEKIVAIASSEEQA